MRKLSTVAVAVAALGAVGATPAAAGGFYDYYGEYGYYGYYGYPAYYGCARYYAPCCPRYYEVGYYQPVVRQVSYYQVVGFRTMVRHHHHRHHRYWK